MGFGEPMDRNLGKIAFFSFLGHFLIPKLPPKGEVGNFLEFFSINVFFMISPFIKYLLLMGFGEPMDRILGKMAIF